MGGSSGQKRGMNNSQSTNRERDNFGGPGLPMNQSTSMISA